MVNKLRLQLTSTPNFIYFVMIPFIVGLVGLSLLTAFKHKLSSLDQGIASFAMSQTSSQNNSYPFDTGCIHFLNKYLAVVVIIPILTLATQLIFNIVYLKMHFKQHLHFYLHVLVSSIAYFVLVSIFMFILKLIFKRPRPLQTKQFAPLFTDENQRKCLQEYCIGFTICNRPNPCKLFYESCPSGHTTTLVSLVYIGVYVSLFDYFYTKAETTTNFTKRKKFKINIAVKLCLIYTNLLISTIFIPSVMIARMMILKHFFTDVVGGLCISIMFIPALMIMQPNYKSVGINNSI